MTLAEAKRNFLERAEDADPARLVRRQPLTALFGALAAGFAVGAAGRRTFLALELANQLARIIHEPPAHNT